MIYIVILFFVLIYGLLGNVNKTEIRKKIYLIIVFGILTLISSIRRYDVGIDLEIVYKPIFEVLKKCSWNELNLINIEVGYAILNKTILMFTGNYQIFIMLTSAFINFTYAKFIFKNSKDVAISTSMYLLLNVYFMGMNIIRQEIAVCILLYAYEYMKKNKKVIPILLIGLAISIHTSAIIGIVYFWFKRIKVDYKIFSILIIVMCILLLALNIILPQISNIVYDFGISNNKNYATYLNGNTHGEGKINTNSIINIFISIMIFVMFFDVVCKKQDSEKSRFLFYANFCYMFFTICILKVSVMSRFIYYFVPFVLIAIPDIFYEIKNKDNQLIVFSTAYLFLIIRYIYICNKLADYLYGVVPYKVFWK